MAKQITNIRDFMDKARRSDVKSIKVKKNSNITKFKVRTSKYLYTLTVNDKEKADKISQSLPVGLEVIYI